MADTGAPRTSAREPGPALSQPDPTCWTWDQLALPHAAPAIAQAALAETLELMGSAGWRLQLDQGGVVLETREVEFLPPGGGRPRPIPTLRGSILVHAPRAQVFAYLSDLHRTGEWDPTDRGHRIVEQLDPTTCVAQTFSQLPLPMEPRESVFLITRQGDLTPTRSVIAYKSARHPGCPLGEHPRMSQHLFAWVIDDRAPNRCALTVVVTVPDGLLPPALLRRMFVQGWGKILGTIRDKIVPPLPAPGRIGPRGLANALQMLSRPHPFLLERHRRSPGGFQLEVGPERWTILTGPEAQRFFYGLGEGEVDPFPLRLRMPTLHLPGAHPPQDVFESTLLSRTWAMKHFSQLDPSALVEQLRSTACSALDERIPPSGEVPDLFRVVLESCALMVARVLLGEEVCARLPGDFARMYGDIEASLSLRQLIVPGLPSRRAQQADTSRQRLVRSLLPLINERRGALSADPPDDLLQTYLEATRADGTPLGLSNAHIVWLLNSLHWAAHHYPAVHGFWATLALLRSPEMLARAREEQAQLGEISAATLARMPFLQACIRESMRLHPVTLLPRVAQQTLTYQGMTIPRGEILALSPLLEHQNPEIFPDPERFDPERWLGERGRAIPNTAFIPGGGGRWGCVGLRFTLTMLSTLCATLLRDWDLHVEGPPHPRGQLLLMPPARPIPARLRRRSPAPPPRVHPRYELAYRSGPRDLDVEVVEIEGQLPGDLEGTLLRNGAGLLEVGQDVVNYVDGHGLVGALTLRGGRAFFRSRLVQTDLLEEEQRAQRQVRRRLFTNLPRRWGNLLALHIGNPANHDVYLWGGRLLASNDPGHYALDPATLATLGPDRWGGVAPAGAMMSPMPRWDPVSDHLVAWSLRPGALRGAELSFHEFDRAWVERARVTHTLERRLPALHDLAFTPRWYVAIDHPVTPDLPALLWGQKTLDQALVWDHEATPTVLLIPRGRGSSPPVRVTLPAGALTAFHIVGCFERGEELILDVVAASGPPEVSAVCPPKLRERLGEALSPPFTVGLVRYVLHPATGQVESRSIGGIQGDMASINPASHGRPYRWAYLLLPACDGDEPVPGSVFWSHKIAKVEVDSGQAQIWHAGATCFCSQPVFAPRRGSTEEDDGYVLSYVFDADRDETSVVILDARALARGPVARLHLGHPLPPTIHCRFTPEGVGLG